MINKWLCCHEWEKLQRVDSYANANDTIPSRITFYYSCKKCGKIKKIDVK